MKNWQASRTTTTTTDPAITPAAAAATSTATSTTRCMWVHYLVITGGVVPLLHCDICPASYHISCLPPSARASSTANATATAGASWTCPSCKSGRKPLYGDIVWVKYSNYRSVSSNTTTTITIWLGGVTVWTLQLLTVVGLLLSGYF